MQNYYNENDVKLSEMLDKLRLCGVDCMALGKNLLVTEMEVFVPGDGYTFTHETAVIVHNGVIYASWYNNPVTELYGVTPIRGRTSNDGGRTWSEIRTYAEDRTGKILFCPPVYGECDGKLYMLMNEMVSADHIHALDLYVLNEESGEFEKLWSRPIPFKLNTNVIHLESGKLMLAGRIAELDGFPNTPAVLISDSGKIDDEWRLVKIMKNGDLPDGSALVHPEICPIVHGKHIEMFCRDDNRNVPLIFVSDDEGETWSAPYEHDIPFSNSKIYSGTLEDGRDYVIGNIYPGRSKLVILFRDKGESLFTDGFAIQDGYSENLGFGGEQWSYPVAHEWEGKLYVIYSAVHLPLGRGAAMTVIPL